MSFIQHPMFIPSEQLLGSLIERSIDSLSQRKRLLDLRSQLLTDSHVVDLLDEFETRRETRKHTDAMLKAHRVSLSKLSGNEEISTTDIFSYNEGDSFKYLKKPPKAGNLRHSLYVSSKDCYVRDAVPKADYYVVTPLKEGASITFKYGKGRIETTQYFMYDSRMQSYDRLYWKANRDDTAAMQVIEEFARYCVAKFDARPVQGLKQPVSSNVYTLEQVLERQQRRVVVP